MSAKATNTTRNAAGNGATRRSRGFTLVELVVAVAIVGITT